MDEGGTDAQIAQQDRKHLPPAHAPAEKHETEQQGQRRIGEQNQAFETGGNVTQADEVEDARAVVAEQAERSEHQPVTTTEWRRRTAGMEADPDKDRQCEHHAQREQCHGINRNGLRYRIGKLDEDRLERKAERGEDGQRHAKSFSGPVFPGHVVSAIKRSVRKKRRLWLAGVSAIRAAGQY